MGATSGPSSQAERRLGPREEWKVLFVLLTAGVLGTLTILHARGLNGPWYWRWPWTRLDAARLVPGLLLASGPFLLAQLVRVRDGAKDSFAVTLLMLSTLGLELCVAGEHRRRFDLGSIADAVEDPVATSYFSDAQDALREGLSVRAILGTHAQRMERLRVHTRFKPPGLLLYHLAFLRAFGPTRFAALAAGLTLAALSTLSVGGTYLLIARLTRDKNAAFFGASFFSLCPSLVLFLPEFDQVYPALACLLVVVWAEALARDRAWLSLAFGLLLAVSCFLSQMFLVLGIFLAAFTILSIAGGGSLRKAAAHALLAAGAAMSFYLVLAWATGYDAVGTYRTASRLLARYSVRAERPYPIHVVFDLLDFALGTGWISVPLAAFFVLGRGKVPEGPRRIAQIALFQILLTAALGIVPAETARTWTLMAPFLMIPVGIELSGWSPRARIAAWAALLFVLGALAQNMVFVIRSRA